VTNRIFAGKLGKILHRPSWLPIPSYLLRIILGEMSSVVLEGQRVLPKKLLSAGFIFTYPEIEKTLAEIFSDK
jgi:NAD dependent epimerase/dehydratase family enzyme